MEKFAVDLEKVLNEFEYNEERRESGPTSSIRTPHSSLDSMGALRQQPLPLPAAIYRKPSFERINLADANFAASPPKSSGLNFSHGLYEVPHEHAAYSHKPQVLNNRSYAQEPSLTNELNINKQVINEHHNYPLSKDWQHSTIPVYSEEKPDLLEYNSTTADSDLNGVDIHNQLPDITTSVRTTSHNVNDNDLPNSLDLISSANGALLTENNKAYLTSNNLETNLKSDGFTFKERISVEEIDHVIPAVSNKQNDVTLTSDHVTLQVETKLNKTVGVYDRYDEDIKPVQTQLINMNENEQETSEGKYETLNENYLDSEKNNEIDENRCEGNKDVSNKTLNEYQELSEDKTNDCNSECDVDSKIIGKPKVIGFGNDEEFSQGELLEYLESIHKDFEEDLDDQVPISEKSIELPNKKNIDLDKTDCKTLVKNDSFRRSFDTSTDNIESTIDTSKNNLLPVNSLQSNSEYNTDLSTKIILQNGENCLNKSEYLPQTGYKETKSEKSKLSHLESSKSNLVIALDYTNELDIKASSHKHNEPDRSTNTIQHSTITKEENQEESVISSSTVQTIEAKSTNPFEQDGYGSNRPEIETKIKSTNPFEDDNEESPECDHEKPLKNNTGNPFEDSPENPFESNCGTLCDDVNVSEVSQESTRCNNSQKIKSVDKSVTSNNSAFSRASVSEVTREVSESLQENNSSSVVAESSVETVLNQTEKSVSSTQGEIEKISIPNTSENKVKIESAEEIPSTDCSPSGSSLDSEALNDSLCSAKMIPIKQAVESSLDGLHFVDEAGIPAEEDRPLRPNSLELPQKITVESSHTQSAEMSEPGTLETETASEDRRLGKIAPFWIPDADTTMCMQCQLKFTVIRRRHHCRACGQVLCSKCCGLKARIEYMDFEEARVCQPCFTILEAVSASEAASPQRRRPNPNNPMEYCSTIPPLEQARGSMHQPPPSVMVPVSVLKREGRIKSDVTKQVMFSDGIRPGGDLTELDGSTEPRMPFRRSSRLTKRVGTPPGGVMSPSMRRVMDSSTHSFIPAEGDSVLPPVVTRRQGEVNYLDLESPIELNQPVVKFALNRNLFVLVKRVLLDCCVNRECWCFSSEGLACVGQDEVVFLLECLPQETQPPKDVFLLINVLYQDAAKGSTVSEMSFTPATSNNLLGSRDHGGFLYIRTSYQCTSQLALPSPPYLVAVLVHRWETPWARLFPIRLMLRLGAEFRYYPCPLVSVRNRQPLYTDIGHTIISILADFRKYSYTLPSVRGLVIHMEDRQTTINIPRNRYDQVVRALNNSNDSVLAFGANLSLAADSHLVCMQTSEDENTSYHTQAINIHNKPRKVTGASFVVFNGALKVPGLAGKSNIVEDGLMVQVPNETMAALRTALRDMRDYCIGCGPNAEETVLLQWTADDTNFNIGVKSCIDGKALDGVPSIRVHNGTDYSGGMRLIRWTEVFILQCEDSDHANEPLDISRLSESIARATCLALVPLLDLLSAACLTTLAVRTTIHPDNVGYEAGSNGEKLPPLYMKSLDNELVAVVHQAALVSQDNPAVLELVFRIMEQG